MPPLTDDKIKVCQDWLKLTLHSMTCMRPASECPIPESCQIGKQILLHLLHCDSKTCKNFDCAVIKTNLKHFISCQNPFCRLCFGVLPAPPSATMSTCRPGCPPWAASACAVQSDTSVPTVTASPADVPNDPFVKLLVLLFCAVLHRTGGENIMKCKKLVEHVLDCGEQVCGTPGCNAARSLLRRSVTCECEGRNCSLCAPTRAIFCRHVNSGGEDDKETIERKQKMRRRIATMMQSMREQQDEDARERAAAPQRRQPGPQHQHQHATAR